MKLKDKNLKEATTTGSVGGTFTTKKPFVKGEPKGALVESEEIEETTSTGSVGGQYASKFAFKKGKPSGSLYEADGVGRGIPKSVLRKIKGVSELIASTKEVDGTKVGGTEEGFDYDEFHFGISANDGVVKIVQVSDSDPNIKYDEEYNFNTEDEDEYYGAEWNLVDHLKHIVKIYNKSNRILKKNNGWKFPDEKDSMDEFDAIETRTDRKDGHMPKKQHHGQMTMEDDHEGRYDHEEEESEPSETTHMEIFEILEKAEEVFGEESDVFKKLEAIVYDKLDIENPDGFISNDVVLEISKYITENCYEDDEEIIDENLETQNHESIEETEELEGGVVEEAESIEEVEELEGGVVNESGFSVDKKHVDSIQKDNVKNAKDGQLTEVKVEKSEVTPEQQKKVINPEEEGDYLATVRQGMEDLEYDNINDATKKRFAELIDAPTKSVATTDEFGHKTPAMEKGNIIKSDVPANMNKKVKALDAQPPKPLYDKDPQPVKMVKENLNVIVEKGLGYQITKREKIQINEQAQKMRHLMNAKPKKA